MVPNKALHEATTEADRNWQDRVRSLTLGIRQWIPKYESQQVKDEVYECHTICTALAWYFPELTLVNGIHIGPAFIEKDGNKTVKFCTCEHSWLQTPDRAILDPYPPGIITLDVILIPTKGDYYYFAGSQYQQDENFKFVLSREEIQRKAEILFGVFRRYSAREKK